MNRRICVLALLAFAVGSADAQDGRLQRVFADINAPAAPNPPSDLPRPADDDSTLGSFLNGLFTSDDVEDNELSRTIVLATVLAPFYIPAAVLHDDYQHTMYFARFPYANGYGGYQLLKPALAADAYSTNTDGVRRRSWVGRVSIENGNDGAGLNRFNGQLRIDHASRFGIITNWNYFSEDLGRRRTADATIGDTNLIFRFAQNEVASVYAGIGWRVLANSWGTNSGVNFTYGGDWYPIRPLVVSSVLDIGTLGNTSVFHARGTIGALVHRWEFFAGYDFTRIGVTNLQGPMAGIRYWF